METAAQPKQLDIPLLLEQYGSFFLLVMGQDVPALPEGAQWPMSNNAIYYALRALAAQVQAGQQVQAAQQALLAALASGLDQQSAQVRVLTGQMQLAHTDSQTLLAGQAADQLRFAALEAKDVLLVSATEANRLDNATTQTAATAAMKKAEDNAAALLVVQGKAEAAQATATTAQQAQAAFASRFRSVRVTLPQIPAGVTIDVVVSFAAFADTNYTAIAEPSGLALLGLDATEVASARTASTATFRIKNVLGLLIAAGGVLNFLAMHD